MTSKAAVEVVDAVVAVAVGEGRELRIRPDGATAVLALWWPVPAGMACAGEAAVNAAGLRRVIAALQKALWAAERAEAGR